MRVLVLLLVSLLQVSTEAAATVVPVEDNPFWVMFVDTL